MDNKSLLDGVRIIDLSRVLAGPFCTMILGDLGADVIKIERPELGDDTRHWGPPFAQGGESAYFLSINRNKRSLTLNVRSEEGLQILKELIQTGDVLVENFRTGTLEHWGLDYEALQRIRPGLIYCSITGYGHTGPYRHRAGYDILAQAMGGFMSVTGPADGEPHRAGVAIADLAAGMFAAQAILAALYRHEKDGSGQCIDMALLDSQIALMTYVASNYLITSQVPQRLGNAHPNIVPYEVFKAQDGFFAFGAGNDGQWKTFSETVGHPEWATDERFATNPQRVSHREELIQLLKELFLQRDMEEWLSLCEEMGLPAAPIHSLDRVFSDPQSIAREMRVEVQHPTAGIVSLVGSAHKIPTSPPTLRFPPPLLGQHTEEILQELLGYEPETIESLRENGVV
ncbi:MAG: formyl-CoA transferase [Chloroflexi bacterium RBG_16_48_8]|nr:MAG: formyl-CoA transferase [Chloroflexi bacterium RBG_16_48_8]